MEKENYDGAYSVSFVENFFHEINQRNWIEAYLIGVASKGGADGNGLSPTFWDREVYNRKKELAVGFREAYQVKEYLRLLFEMHYAQRQDGDNDWASMTKLSFSPTIVPTEFTTLCSPSRNQAGNLGSFFTTNLHRKPFILPICNMSAARKWVTTLE